MRPHDGVPPLNAGDRLSRAEFERRYGARPDLKKAELIEGVVHIPSPVRFVQHGQAHIALAGWLANYLAATPGVTGGDNVTVRLDYENEVQPDAFLRLDVALGGAFEHHRGRLHCRRARIDCGDRGQQRRL